MFTKIKLQGNWEGDEILKKPYKACYKCHKDIEGNHQKMASIGINNDGDLEIWWVNYCEKCTIEIGKLLQLKQITNFENNDVILLG